MMLALIWGLPKTLALFWLGPSKNMGRLMLKMPGALEKRGPAEAHDAGMVLGPSKNVGGLMLMMLALFWGSQQAWAG